MDAARTHGLPVWMNKYYPQPDTKNSFIEFGYYGAKLVVQLLKQCGTGIDPNLAQMRVIRFDRKKWEPLPD